MRVPPDRISYLLRECIQIKDIETSRITYSLLLEDSFILNARLTCLLIKVFSSCGNIVDASKVFSSHVKSVHTWSAIILAYAQHGESERAFLFFKRMQMSSIAPNVHTYVAILKACPNMQVLYQVHTETVKERFDGDSYVGNMLLNMYSKLGNIETSRRVFDELHTWDTVACSAMITAYVNHERGQEAISLFHEVWKEKPEPNDVMLLCTLKACSSEGCVSDGQLLHTEITKWFQLNVFNASAVIDMYAKCDCMQEAQNVFDALDVPNLICWNAIISGYASCRDSMEALCLLNKMQQAGLEPNETTLVSALKACANILAVNEGMSFHITILKQGLEWDQFIGNSLLFFYAKCDCVLCAYEIFEKLEAPSLVSWSAMISGLVGAGHDSDAVTFYHRMYSEGIEPDISTLVSALKACSSLQLIKEGRAIYFDCVQRGLEADMTVGNALLDMFVKCNDSTCSKKVFDLMEKKNVVTYSSLISGYTDHGHDMETIQLVENMHQAGIKPNEVTYICILKACGNLKDLVYGKLMHALIIVEGFDSIFTVRATLIVMYTKLGCLLDAYEVFNQSTERDVVLWSAIISGFSELGYVEEALKLFEQMKLAFVNPNQVTFACVLKACTSLASLEYGKLIHAMVIKQGIEFDTFTGNSLIDMYAKCGSMVDACNVFDSLPVQDLVSWSAIIEGYANHGLSHLALQCFNKMQSLGINPLEVTYVSVLSACSSVGLIEEGQFYFAYLGSRFSQTVEHYACLVDLLGRAGQLDLAETVVRNIPVQSEDVIVWMTFLGACVRFANLESGKRAYAFLMETDCRSITMHILLSNIYVGNRKWKDAKRLQDIVTWILD